MSDSIYFGSYERFDTVSKKDAAQLLGADNLVGDVYEIEFSAEDGQQRAWMKNRFEARVGYFNDELSRKLSIYHARGWRIVALLSLVAFTDTPEPGIYWGEAALISYDPRKKAFDAYVTKLSSRLSEGNRPTVELSQQGIKQVLESNGTWAPSKLLPSPEKKSGTAYIKTRRSYKEKLIEQGRAGNKGCYFGSILSFIVLIFLAVFGLKACGIF